MKEDVKDEKNVCKECDHHEGLETSKYVYCDKWHGFVVADGTCRSGEWKTKIS